MERIKKVIKIKHEAKMNRKRMKSTIGAVVVMKSAMGAVSVVKRAIGAMAIMKSAIGVMVVMAVAALHGSGNPHGAGNPRAVA